MSANTAHPKDCLSCRIICSISLTCAGLFIGYHGCRYQGYNRAGMLAIATRKLTSFYCLVYFLACKTTFCNDDFLLGFGAVRDWSVGANVSENHTVSIFKAEDGDSMVLHH
jgi:hypothetical protein